MMPLQFKKRYLCAISNSKMSPDRVNDNKQMKKYSQGYTHEINALKVRLNLMISLIKDYDRISSF